MADEDPLAQLRKSISTSKSRVSSRPIDPTEETFMGASIGAKPSSTTPAPAEPVQTASEEPAPAIAAPSALLGAAPRRRRKKSAGEGKAAATAIDPEELAKFAMAQGVAGGSDTEAKNTEEPRTDGDGRSGLMLSPSPPPEPKPAEELLATSPEPTKRSSPAMAKSPVPIMEKQASPVAAKEPGPIQAAPPSPRPQPQQQQDLQSQLLHKDQQLSEYEALCRQLLPPATSPSAPSLALFLKERLAKADRCDMCESELDAARRELDAARSGLAAAEAGAPPSEQAAALEDANTKLASIADQRDALQQRVDLLEGELRGRDEEIGVLRDQMLSASAGDIRVESMEQLEQEMQVRFKETSEFIKEMESFLKEHQLEDPGEKKAEEGAM